MGTTTQVSPSIAEPPVAPANYDLQPSHASVYNIPERPRARVPRLPPMRYEEYLTADASDVEKYHPAGYGKISVSERYGVVETGGDNLNHPVPRPGHVHPCTCHQAANSVSDPVSEFDLGGLSGPLLMSGVRSRQHRTIHRTPQARNSGSLSRSSLRSLP